MRRLPIALVLLLLAPVVCAQVYKWTDAHGTVHYSETPPPQGTPFKRITTSGVTEVAPAPAPAQTTESSQTREPEPETTVRDTPENRAKLCTSLKTNLETLSGKGPVVMEDHGKQVALDDSQRSQQIDSARKQYEQYCSH